MLNATVREKTNVTSNLLKLKVQPDRGVPPFAPGQYLTLGLLSDPADPKSLLQQVYSIVSPPTEFSSLEFLITVIPQGTLTPKLHLLEEGERLYVSPRARGKFTLIRVPPSANLILIATGTGIAPYISMLRSPATLSEQRRVTLIHGVRYAAELAYHSELLSWDAAHANFTYLPIVSRAEPAWAGQRGRVQFFLETKTLAADPHGDYVFLCGNPHMVSDLQSRFKCLGFSPRGPEQDGNLYTECYWETADSL